MDEKTDIMIQKQMENCVKRFMDKVETKKTFKTFEKQLKNLFDIFISKFEEQDIQDAMLAKRPLGNFACASCAKKITNLQGTLAEYQTTGKFPYRDPKDRIFKVGAGFSRMLTCMQPNSPLE